MFRRGYVNTEKSALLLKSMSFMPYFPRGDIGNKYVIQVEIVILPAEFANEAGN